MLENKWAEEQTQRWEDQRAVKNLMGKYAWSILLRRERSMLADFWSRREDISLGVNNGWYLGQSGVAGYYEGVAGYIRLRSKLLAQELPERFEGMSDEQIYGAGTLEEKPLSSELVEVAADGNSAKGIWTSQGTYDRMTECGVTACWTWGYFAGDFVRENGQWRILHLQYLEDINHPCGEKWWQPEKPKPVMEHYRPLADYRFPEPTVPCTLRSLYAPHQAGVKPPRMPQPYTTLAETFSYGYEEAGT